jgi:orotate phosphoribosyltransferase-like protein
MPKNIMPGTNEELREKIRKLQEGGLNDSQIARILNLPPFYCSLPKA